MWYYSAPLKNPNALEEFEQKFRFLIPEPFKDFLHTYNAASAVDVDITTDVATRTLTTLLDFDTGSSIDNWNSAWSLNKRMRPYLGERHIAFASVGNQELCHLLCLERQQRKRVLVVWNFITQQFEPVHMSWEEFLLKYSSWSDPLDIYPIAP